VTYVAQLGTGKGNCATVFFMVCTSPYFAGLWIARATGRPAACFAGSRGNGAFFSTALINSMHLSQPTSIRLWYGLAASTSRSRPCWRLVTPHQKETSTDTSSIGSRTFSGLIATVRSQEARLFASRNRSDDERHRTRFYESKTRPARRDADLMVIAEQELGLSSEQLRELFGFQSSKACDRGLD